ncbi:hypothetical protein FPQ18DRAFT_419152, partial [Pyronema domesticum]
MFGNWSSLPISHGPDGQPVLSQIYKYKGPLSFPGYGASTSKSDPTFPCPANERSFYSYFAKVKRATDVTREHLDLLNVSVEYNVPVQDLVGGTEWLPKDDDEIWAEREKELLIENNVATEVMARIRRDVKLGHMYKFFQSLEMVLPYYGTPEECAAEEEKLKAQGTDGADKMDIDGGDPNDNGKRPAVGEASGDHAAKKDKTDAEEETEDTQKKEEKFSMPERFRDDLVKNFVEPICWGHGVRLTHARSPPRPSPKFNLQCSRFSIHLNYHIYKTPDDPQEARSGLVDGPVMGMQIRHEHAFKALADPQAGADGTPQDIVGITREIVALLSIAQLRARDGTSERKVRFRAIGKEEGYWDDVFMVTCLHHHVSISHLRVSKPYLRFLKTGKLPNKDHPFIKEGGWEKLQLRKTRYWSLMEPKERTEAARALVTVLKWATRNEGK